MVASLILVLGGQALAAAGEFRFANTHSDGMVLQAAPQNATVWGFASSSESEVKVCLSPSPAALQTQSACVAAVLSPSPDGSKAQLFTATLPATPPGTTPYDVSAVSGSGQKAALSEVLFGDVYVCSGQSNMDFAMPMSFNATEEGEIADHFPYVRLFTVQKCRSGPCLFNKTGPQLELLNSSFAKWEVASKDSVYGAQPWTREDYGGWEGKIGQCAGGRGFSGACWFFGREMYKKRQYPIGLVWSSYGGTVDEYWMPPVSYEECNLRPGHASGWDLMINPLIRNVVAGAVFYQGESNQAEGLKYNCTFPAMIDGWRQMWHNGTGGQSDRHFPFGFVQLSVHGGYPCYGEKACYNEPTWSLNYAGVRWAQTASYGTVPNPAMPNTFMATAVDLGEPSTPAGGPHVRDKENVGKRLAMAFGDNFIKGDGPFYTPGAVALKATATGSSVTVAFGNLPPLPEPLSAPFSALGLEVSEEAGLNASAWYNATSATASGSTITIGTKLSRVQQVRYLWSSTPCLGWDSTTEKRETGPSRCPLYTAAGLPVLPFIINVTGAV